MTVAAKPKAARKPRAAKPKSAPEAQPEPTARTGILVVIVRRAAPIAPKHLFAEYVSFDLPGLKEDMTFEDIINDHFVADRYHVLDVTEIPE